MNEYKIGDRFLWTYYNVPHINKFSTLTIVGIVCGGYIMQIGNDKYRQYVFNIYEINKYMKHIAPHPLEATSNKTSKQNKISKDEAAQYIL